MAEDDPVTPPPDPPAEEESGGIGERVDRLEAAVHTLISKLTGGGKPADPGQPATVAEEVQRELARRDEAKKKAEADEAMGKIKADLASLMEKPPEAPVRKVEKIMGWHG